jgi:probable selenate reductase FAD-binding subunit
MPTLRELTEYHTPTTLDDALKLLRRRKIHTVPIGGGGSLVADAPREVQAVVDLSQLGLSFVEADANGLTIGATTTLQTLLDDQRIHAYAGGVLLKALRDTAGRNVRESATLAGAIVAARSNSPLVTALLALNAHITTHARREQTAPLSEWLPSNSTLITRLHLPALPAEARAAYEKVARTPADLPIVCVAAMQIGKGVRLALGGVAERPIVMRLTDVTPDQASQHVRQAIYPPSDYFASADYRREMAGVLVKRALS